jgi:hypothetical protein
MSKDSLLAEILIIAVRILPLFLIPILIKKSLDSLGNISGIISNIGSKISGGATSKWAGSDLNKHIEQNRRKDEALVSGGAYAGKNPFKQIQNKLNRGFNTSKFSGEFGNRRAAKGAELTDQIETEDIKASAKQLDNKNFTKLQLRQLATGQNVTSDGTSAGNVVMANTDKNLRSAAIQKMVATNDVKGINDAWDTSSTWDDSLRLTFAASLQSSSSRPAYITGGALEDLRQGGAANIKTTQQRVEEAINKNVYSAEKIATADKDELHVVANAAHSGVRSGAIQAAEHMVLVRNAALAQTDPILSTKIGKNAGHVTDISTGSVARDRLV